ncbi:MAG: glycosyltransferase family 2 protein [Thermostichales cyanobacterium BF3_bins_165]
MSLSSVSAPTGGVPAFVIPAHSQPGILLSLVIPTYNESRNIQLLLNRLVELLDPLLPNAYELIVVDDDSPDQTWLVASKLQDTFPQVRVIRRQQERGLSTAVVRGWQQARGEILGVMDGDLQHDPRVVVALWQAIQGGCDLAVASRHTQGGGVEDWGWLRRLGSEAARWLGILLLPRVVGRIRDPLSGYFLLRRGAIANRILQPKGYKILIEVLGRGDIARIQEVGYVFQSRQLGHSKATWKQAMEYIEHLLRLRLALWPVKRFTRFITVGFMGMLVDSLLLFVFHDPQMLNWNLNLSKVIASETAIFHNFIWNDRWTFGDLSHHKRGWGSFWLRFLRFNLICTSGLLLNLLIINLLTRWLGIHYLIANIVAVGMVAFWNFGLNATLNWRSRSPREELVLPDE